MNKSTWIIVILIVLLGSIYLFTRNDRVSVGVKRISLPSFANDQVDRIEIKSKASQIVLKKHDSHWLIDIPVNDKTVVRKADSDNVKAMLDAAHDLRHSNYVTNQKDKYKELGLEGEESTQIDIFVGDKAVWSLLLGKNATGTGRYAKIPDDQDVHVVRGSFWQLTRNEPSDWRDREIMPVKEGEIKAFKLKKRQALNISLEKNQDEWQFKPSETVLPKGYRPNNAELTNLVRAVLNMRATNFVDNPMNLVNPVLTVEGITEDKSYILEFFPASSADIYWARRLGDEQIYEVSKYNFERIDKSLDELRDLSLFKLDRAQIVKLTLKHGPSSVIVSKTDNKWQIDQPKNLPKDFEFDPERVDDILSMLAGLQAQRLADPKKDIAQDHNWQQTWLVEMTTKDGQNIHFFTSKSKTKDESLVKGNIDDQIYVIKTARLGSLLEGLPAFKKEEFDMPPVDENTQGFKNLPVDIQRKLLDATKKKQ